MYKKRLFNFFVGGSFLRPPFFFFFFSNFSKELRAEELIDSFTSQTQYDHNSIDWGYYFEAPIDLEITGVSYPKALELGGNYFYEIRELEINEYSDFGETFYEVTSQTERQSESGLTAASTYDGISFNAGDYIGVVGAYNNRKHDHNYSETFSTSLDGSSVDLYQLYQHRTFHNQWETGGPNYDSNNRISYIQLEIPEDLSLNKYRSSYF